MDKQIKIKSEEVKGPKTNAPDQALEGFLRSNRIEKKDLFKSKTERGEFYFYKTKPKSLKITTESGSYFDDGEGRLLYKTTAIH